MNNKYKVLLSIINEYIGSRSLVNHGCVRPAMCVDISYFSEGWYEEKY